MNIDIFKRKKRTSVRLFSLVPLMCSVVCILTILVDIVILSSGDVSLASLSYLLFSTEIGWALTIIGVRLMKFGEIGVVNCLFASLALPVFFCFEGVCIAVLRVVSLITSYIV